MFANTYLQQADKPNYDAHQLLWPVNMWQVYTSQSQGRQLNLFEKGILQLFNVSKGRPLNNSQLAQWLGLEVDMVSFIVVAQLIPNGWLTKKGLVTEKGKRLLDEEILDRLTTAFIFQCAITGQWLPRLSFSLKEIFSCNGDGRPKFKLNRASDYKEVPFMVAAGNSNNHTPTEKELKEISENFQEALHIAENTRDTEQWQPELTKVDKLTLASTVGTPAYLTVWGDTSSSYEWTIYDPFDISTSSKWMLDLFKNGCKTNSHLGRFALSKLGAGGSDLSYEDTCRKFEEDAKFKVLVSYSDAEKIEGLTDALFQWLEANERSKKERFSNYSANSDFIIKSVKIVEVACSFLLKRYPLNRPKRLPYAKTKNAKDILSKLLVEATNMSGVMATHVLKVNASKVYSAAICRNSSVRAQLAAVFISMETHKQHPLKFILKNEAHFSNFYNITHLRDDCSHGSLNRINKQQVLIAMNTIDTFLNELFIGIQKNG